METWEALRSRRNVREFSSAPVSEEDLAKILEAGRLAPSAKNWQPWNFVLVTDREQLRELTGVWQGAWHVGGAAAAIAIVAPKPPDDRWAGLLQYDLGHATMLMMLAAADLGIGTCHSSVQDQELARKILGFPDDHFLAYLRLARLPGRRAARGRSSGSTGDRSTRSCTAAAGSAREFDHGAPARLSTRVTNPRVTNRPPGRGLGGRGR